MNLLTVSTACWSIVIYLNQSAIIPSACLNTKMMGKLFILFFCPSDHLCLQWRIKSKHKRFQLLNEDKKKIVPRLKDEVAKNTNIMVEIPLICKGRGMWRNAWVKLQQARDCRCNRCCWQTSFRRTIILTAGRQAVTLLLRVLLPPVNTADIRFVLWMI